MLIVELVALTAVILELINVTLSRLELRILHHVDTVEFLIVVLPVVEARAACASVGE